MSIQSEINRLAAIKAQLKSAINGAAGSVVGDVFADYPAAITSGKASIAAAITDKGVETAADATFQTMAANIGAIETGAEIETVGFTFEDQRGDYSCFFTDESLQSIQASSGIYEVLKNSYVIIYGGDSFPMAIPGGTYEEIVNRSDVYVMQAKGDCSFTIIFDPSGGGSG